MPDLSIDHMRAIQDAIRPLVDGTDEREITDPDLLYPQRIPTIKELVAASANAVLREQGN